jgi:hypothetical protein
MPCLCGWCGTASRHKTFHPGRLIFLAQSHMVTLTMEIYCLVELVVLADVASLAAGYWCATVTTVDKPSIAFTSLITAPVWQLSSLAYTLLYWFVVVLPSWPWICIWAFIPLFAVNGYLRLPFGVEYSHPYPVPVEYDSPCCNCICCLCLFFVADSFKVHLQQVKMALARRESIGSPLAWLWLLWAV